jgi:chlorobactene glucosyltransferase
MTTNSREIGSAKPVQQVAPTVFLFARLAGAVISSWVVITGSSTLEWIAVAVMFWFLVVVWGRHVLFIDNLNGLPNLNREISSESAPPQFLPAVSVVVPARNEELDIERAATAWGEVSYPELEVIFVDDHSSDRTAEILERVTRRFPHLRFVSSPDLPAGWTGKTYASWFGFQQSNETAGWLLFTDARVMFSRDAISKAIAHAEANRLGFLSCVIRFDGENLAEELFAIAQNRGLLMSAREFGGVSSPVPFGIGAFSLIRRDLYAGIGGHAAFPEHPIEDFMLADSARRAGAKLSAAVASGLVSIRRYHGFRDMRRRSVRLLRLSSGDRLLDLLNRLSLEFCFLVVPLLVAIGSLWRLLLPYRGFHPALAILCLLAFLTYFAGACTARECRQICRVRAWVFWLYPLGAALSTWFVLLAIVQKLCGVSISWRGRVVDLPRPTS